MDILFQQRVMSPMQSGLFSPIADWDFRNMFQPEKSTALELVKNGITYLERCQESISEMKTKSSVSSEVLMKQNCTMYQRASLTNLLAGKKLLAAIGTKTEEAILSNPPVKVQFQFSPDMLPTTKVVNA